MKAWIQNYQKYVRAYTVVASIEEYIQSDLDTDQFLVDSAKYDPCYNLRTWFLHQTRECLILKNLSRCTR